MTTTRSTNISASSMSGVTNTTVTPVLRLPPGATAAHRIKHPIATSGATGTGIRPGVCPHADSALEGETHPQR
jgi:hypothetical protein